MSDETKEEASQAPAKKAAPAKKEKAGPVSAIDTHDRDPVFALYALYAPECLQVGTGLDCFIGDGTLKVAGGGEPDQKAIIAHYKALGYIPVENKGEQVYHNGDPIFKKKVQE